MSASITISGFTYVRNGFTYGYPFLKSMESILPICDELVVAVGDSNDGTREAIQALSAKHNNKIKIIDTLWDETIRKAGKIFAQQANIALAHCMGDWLFHIQADEVIHEDDLPTIKQHIINNNTNTKVDGLLFKFLNFHGNYNYISGSRYQHFNEIRVFKKGLNVYSYRDSQGFRKYPSLTHYTNGHVGIKLNVLATGIPVFHYSYVRAPENMNKKAAHFETFWHDDTYVQQKYATKQEFDYYNIDRVKPYTGKHPAIMQELITAVNWEFNPAKIHKKISLKNKVLYLIEDAINYRIGAYKNYKVV